ncbi:MAG: OB-fold domain-containing protein [Candidatus Thorarchaeota archaeon]|nr:OB-fold domain-containing protein [Candidatus Thorarchaeota archaeon]
MEIEASNCESCKRIIVPPRDICPYCGPNNPMNRTTISNEGTILTFTSLQRPPEGFEPPVLLALVELKGGATVLCLGTRDEQSGTSIGSSVTLRKDSLDRFVYHLAK